MVSEPARGNAYNLGEEIEVRVEFSQAVTVTGAPTLGLTIGTLTRQATYGQAGSSPRYHYFRYMVQATDTDADGFHTTANALTLPAGAHIRNAVNTDALSGLLSTAQMVSSHAIYGIANRDAFVQGLRITSRPASGTTYKLGETITAQVRFSKPVTVTSNPRLLIQMTNDAQGADYTRSVRAQETVGLDQPHYYWLEFSYTVRNQDYDTDGISIREIRLIVSDIQFVLGTIVGTGDGGVAADTRVTDHSLNNQASHKVEGRQPSLTSLEFYGGPANLTRCNDPDHFRVESDYCDQAGRRDAPSYFEGETVQLLATFSGPVTVTSVNLPLGLASGDVTATSWAYHQPTTHNYTKVLIKYTVQANDLDAAGIAVARRALTGDIRSRTSGNPALLGHDPLGKQTRHAILRRTQAPALIDYATVQSQPYSASAGYDVDEYIRVGVVFDEQVNVTGNPQLSIQVGSNTRTASYVGSNGTILTFRYLVQAGDVDTDGINLPANALSLNGGTINTRRNSLAATITADATAAFAGHRVNGAQNGAPNVTGVAITSLPVVGNTYGAAEMVEVVVTFHKRVAVSTTPQLALTLGSATVQAAVYSQPDDLSVSFRYLVQSADRDLNGLSVAATALTLNGGTINSHSGVAANLALGAQAITDASSHRVDGRITNRPYFGAIAAKTWYINRAVAATLPASMGGRGSVAYSLSPALPAGLSFNNATRGIAGTPSALTATTTYTLTARDSRGVIGSATFDITIAQSAVPTFGAQTIADQSWTRAGRITPLTLPTASGGDGTLTYTISPAFQHGITLATTTPYTATGVPAGGMAQTQYDWTATDADGETATLSFNVTTASPGHNTPFFGTKTIAEQTWTQNQQILPTQDEDWQTTDQRTRDGVYYRDKIFLPTVVGGGADSRNPDRYYYTLLQYTLSPALPAGVTLATTSPARMKVLPEVGAGQISGTPTVAQARTRYTWTATAPDNDSASVSFYLTIAPDLMPYFTGLIDHQNWVQGRAVTGLTLPAATSGDGTLTYSLTPALPAGVTLDAATRAVSGTPTTATSTRAYMWTATDADGDTASLTFNIGVNTPLSFGSQTIGNKHWAQDLAITGFDLPEAMGGDGMLTYTLTPALPAGVATTTTFAVSGTPTVALSSTQYTWKVMDGDGDTASLTFSINVDSMPTFGSTTIPEQFWTKGVNITPFTLPAATGGNGTLTYILEPPPPNGMTISNSRQVSGASSFAQRRRAYELIVWDEDGDSARLSFYVTIDALSSFGAATIADQSWTQDTAITAVTLPQATDGDSPFTYTLSPALPAGVATTTTAAFTLSGTPTAAAANTEYTWTVTDADGDTASLTFDIAIAADLSPSFGSATIANQTWTQRQAITAFTLPTATGGDGSLTYALTPALPAGTTRNASHEVSGTPTGHQTATTYTWKATDADGDAAQLTFTITINDDLSPSFSTTIADQSWRQRDAITAFTLPAASGGDGTLTYALSPALPAGVSKNASHRVSGTPTGKLASTEYTWTATDGDGDTASLTFDIAIDGVPTFGTQTIPDQDWTGGMDITPFNLPQATGGDGMLVYTITPAWPSGISMSDRHRLSGAPDFPRAMQTYTWKVEDEDGDTAQLTFKVTVPPNSYPNFGGADISDKTWTQRQAITGFNLPTATGGNGTLTHTLSPALPAGVTRATTSPYAVSGTPTGHQTETTYTWKATDRDGDATQLTFTITVAEDLSPSFGATTISNQTWTQNQAIPAFTLPTATGGDTPLTYSISPALPAGLSKNASHRITGTPTGHQTAATYTWKVTDTDGDTAQLTFTIAIAEDLAPTFGATTIANQTWTQNQAITALTLPTATGGDGTLTYAITPALPAGTATTTSAAFTVSGTPTAHQTATTYTWKATDADGDAAQLTFTITITEDLAPSFSTTIANQTWTQNTAITAFTLPTATGGDGSLTYALTPALPAGVSKNASHEVSGTPTGHQTATTYTWKASDTDGDAAELTFTITVTEDLSPSFSTTIANQTWTQNTAITALTLPTATGGDGSLTYALSPALPAGTTKNASHEVSGTPTGHQTATSYTWKATDTDGDTAELTFSITIAEDLSPSFSTTIGNKTWTQNKAITAFTLPTATGGDTPLSYTISPALPSGLSKNASHEVSGTPTGHQTATTYTWKATDTDGDAAELTFSITIAEDLSPSFSTTIANQTWTQNQAITALTLPTATGGDGDLTYALTPALPAGVSKNASHEVSGTPTGHQTETTYTWKATDTDGDAAELTFTITIAQDNTPSFSTTIGNKTWTQNQAITAFTLPTATGGDGSLTYALTPALPAGVSKDNSHEVSGTPTSHQAETTYTWKATDGDGDAAQLTFTITINEDLSPSFGSTTVANQTWTQNTAITAFTLPTATGGDGSLTYALTPSLPAGVSKNASHEVSGTPTGHQTETTYTWKATDADGDAAQLTFTITIAEDLSPSFSTTIGNKTWTQNTAITAFTLPTATGGDGTLNYALTPALPAGTAKNASHEVSGTPTGHQPETTYTWKATDADGDAVELTFTITITEDLSPSFSTTIANQTWTQNQAITAFTLPTATGGDGSLTYALTPALPAGVSKNASHRVSGTPTGHQTATTYTWKASDTDGDAAELTFTITIAEDLSPSFGATTIANQTWTQNQAITAFTLPTATGGDGSLTYALTPALPAGVSKNASHEVSGTPTGHQTETTYTWKATDTDGDAAELTFTITIAEDLSPSFSTTIGNKTWTQNQAITAFTLPTATGGDGSLTYALTPALPAGVSKNASHEVSGTPTGHQTATSYTWKATDADGDAVELTFTITIAQDLAPKFGATTIANQTWTQNTAITALTLPTATGR